MKRRFYGFVLACSMVLCACGEKKEPEVAKEINVEKEEKIAYEMVDMALPDSLMEENAMGSDYIGDAFEGYVSDLQGKPAVYYSTFTKEFDEYYATVIRWQIEENGDWTSTELCEESLSHFFNTKAQQVEWTVCMLDSFRRGDNGSLYGIFTYYVKETVMEEEQEKEQIVPRYSLLEIDEENDRVFEIPLQDVKGTPVEGRGRDAWSNSVPLISDYHVFEDGRVLLVFGDNGGGMASLVDGETGHEIQNMGNIVSGKTRFAFGESEILFYSKDKKMFQVMSIPELEEQNVVGNGLTEEELGKEWFFYMNPDTWELYLFNKEGVYRASDYQSDDQVEYITKGVDFSEVSNGSATILDFFVGDQEDYYICLMETQEEYGIETKMFRMLHYKKVEDNAGEGAAE